MSISRIKILALAVSCLLFCGQAALFAAPNATEMADMKKYKSLTFNVAKLKASQESNGWKGYDLKEKGFVWVDSYGNMQANLPDNTLISIYFDNGKEVYREIKVPSGRTFTLEPGKDPAWNVVGDKAPDFDLPVIANGKGKQKLSDLKGSWVMLDFWASWCQPCMQALPGTEALYKKLKAKGLKVIGVNVDGDKPSALEAAKALKLSFPVVYADAGSGGGRDWDAVQIKDYGISGIPCVILINPEGIVQEFGFVDEDLIEELVINS